MRISALSRVSSCLPFSSCWLNLQGSNKESSQIKESIPSIDPLTSRTRRLLHRELTLASIARGSSTLSRLDARSTRTINSSRCTNSVISSSNSSSHCPRCRCLPRLTLLRICKPTPKLELLRLSTNTTSARSTARAWLVFLEVPSSSASTSLLSAI